MIEFDESIEDQQGIRSEAINRCIAELARYFDSIQVCTTWRSDGNTHCMNVGEGNFYARLMNMEMYISAEK